jgi:hypothetical protein
MRFLSALLFFFILVNFSGIPDVIAGLTDQSCAYVDLNDDADSKEKEDRKEKEEKEDIKESVLAGHLSFHTLHTGVSLETHNGILLDSGYYPEDHSPPPERA